MNYLVELLAFYRWLEEHKMTPMLQAYWHLLMFYNNKAAVRDVNGNYFWPVEFTLPNSMIQSRLGLKDRFQVVHARAHLIKHRRVHYKAHTGNKAGKYTLSPFDKGIEGVWITREKGRGRTQIWTQKITQTAHTDAPFINLINSKQTSLSYTYQGAACDAVSRFKILPELTAAEKEAIRIQYKGDKAGCFAAEWAARERKEAEK